MSASGAPLRILYVTTLRYDFTTATLIQGLNALPDIELRTTTSGNYTRASQVLGRDDAIAYGHQADVIVLGSNRGVEADIFCAIQTSRRVRLPGPVGVFVDGGDNSELAISLERLKALDVMFKREYFLEDNSLGNLFRLVLRIHPGMWGTIRRHAWIPLPSVVRMTQRTTARDVLRNLAAHHLVDKICSFPYGIEERFQGSLNARPAYELSCMLNAHIPERRELVERVRELDLPRTFLGEIPAQPADTERLIALGAVNRTAMRETELGHNPRYYAQISESRRCISVPGGGFDTLRFWEILGQGSLLVSKRIAIEMPHPPREGVHYLAFDSLAELREQLEDSFAHPDRADEIRAAGHAFAQQWHTTRARAMYFLTTLVDRGLLPSDRLPC